jgi:hypothetical protein
MDTLKQIITSTVILFLAVCQMKGQAPDWAVNTTAYQGTMTITGVIQIDGFDSRDLNDMVGVFSGEECRGMARPIYNAPFDRYYVFVSVFGNEMPETMTFKVYESFRDTIYDGEKTLEYTLNGTLGTIGEPHLFEAGALPFIFTMEDKDMDGFFNDVDCDDEDPFINPGGFEIAGDDIDQNCNFSLEAEIPLMTYVNNFDIVSYEFNNKGFGIRQEEGFDSPALHSNHPYGDFFVYDTSNLYSILNIPIIVNSNNPWIRFKEVVLVEPGVAGVVFPDTRFRDYVIVEARKADQIGWTPLLPGYDANDLQDWKDTYEFSIDPFGGASSAKGNKNLFRNQEIDISKHFMDGDTIKIRFRLHSDYFDYGWGWAIDDLEIQNSSTSTSFIDEKPLFKVYPNPFQGERIYLHSDLLEANRLLFISLFDATGNLIVQYNDVKPMIGSQLKLDIPDLPNGTYFLSVNDGKKNNSYKLIKL